MAVKRYNLWKILLIFFSFFHMVLLIKVKDIRFSRKLHGYTMKRVVQVSLSSCAEICQQKVNCVSINYSRMSKICELNSETEDESVILHASRGWVFSDKSNWSYQINSRCKSTACTEQHETCVETPDAFECKIKECIAVPKFENGDVLGNMNNVGSVLSLECHQDYTLIGANKFECAESGIWKDTENTKCIKLCSSPENYNFLDIKDAYIQTPDGIKYISAQNASAFSSMMIMQGSNVTYQCRSQPYAIGVPISYCSAGHWSSLNCISCVDKCAPYLSYSYSEYNCIKLESCKNGYADTFQKYESRFARQNDFKVIENISEIDCRDECLQDQECNSFDYKNELTRGTCFLQRLNDVNNIDFREDDNWSYHQRNCK